MSRSRGTFLRAASLAAWALAAGVCGLALPVRGTAAPEPSAPPRRPVLNVGPYRVQLDRITAARNRILNYRVPGVERDERPLDSRCTVQMQVAVFATDPTAGPGLATFQVHMVTAEERGRVGEAPHYGGLIDTADDGALLRAYLYMPSFPALAREVRTIEGEIVAYEKTEPLRIEVPLPGLKFPASAEKDGVRATVRELTTEGGGARLTLSLEGPPSSILLNGKVAGGYGVSLLDLEGRPASLATGNLVNPRPNQSEYRLAFSNLRAAPSKVVVQIIHRGGARRVYPFRFERVPLPIRPPAPVK